MAVYYPYLRARKYDVLAVGRIAAPLGQTKKVLPIFEPVSASNPTLLNCSQTFANAGLEVALVINPQVGRLFGHQLSISQLLSDMRGRGAQVIPALVVGDDTQVNDLQWLQSQTQGRCIFVHAGVPGDGQVDAMIRRTAAATHVFVDRATGSSHQSSYSNLPRALLRDGFQAQLRNADYPPRSFFGDLNVTYRQLGFSGFGDYATVGDRFSEGGGPAYAVAIHITEDAQSQGIYCNHFLSTSNQTQANPGGKFAEALAELAAYDRQHPNLIGFSTACQELLTHHRTGHFPGLGELKRLSIQHHLELMNRIV